MRKLCTTKTMSGALVAGLLALGLAACDAGGNVGSPNLPGNEDECSVPLNRFADGGVGKDGIPALSDPDLVAADAVDYLAESDRVIGLLVGGRAIAVPHNILWWHEIVNFTFGGVRLAVTYCPLTGSSMAFDRAVVGGAEFGVSGLLFQNNLTMYDRTSQESLWPQMNRAAGCGARNGVALAMVPVAEMNWAGWKSLFPDTEVIAEGTGHARCYTCYPYGNYETPNNASLLFPMSIDARRLPKERVLGIPDPGGGVAFPFFELDEIGPLAAVHERVGGQDVVVFWDRTRRGATAYRPLAGGQALTFEAREGGLFDTQTGSAGRLDGKAVDGPLAGVQLAPVAEAYVAFWFAWAAFEPQTRIFEAAGKRSGLGKGG